VPDPWLPETAWKGGTVKGGACAIAASGQESWRYATMALLRGHERTDQVICCACWHGVRRAAAPGGREAFATGPDLLTGRSVCAEGQPAFMQVSRYRAIRKLR